MILDPDIKLMLEFIEGDISAFEQIMNKYKEIVINIAYRFIQNRSTAEDIAQDVFLKIYNSAKSYKPKARLSTWIYKITANICLNELRSQKKYLKNISMDEIDETRDFIQTNPFENLEKKELKHLVKEAIDSLPDRQRMVIILKKYEDLSYQDISEILGCSLSSVDSLLQRAKQNLKNKLAPFFNSGTIPNQGSPFNTISLKSSWSLISSCVVSITSVVNVEV